MRNSRTIQLLTSWLPAGNGVSTGHTQPVAAELWATEFLTDNTMMGLKPPRKRAKNCPGSLEKATRKHHVSLLDLLVPNCSTVTND